MMSSAAAQEDTTRTEAKAAKSSPYAVLFELEGFAADGRSAAFQVLKSLLRDQGKSLDLIAYARFCLHAFPERYLPELLRALELPRHQASKLAEDVRNGTYMELHSKADPLHPALAEFLHLARGRGVALAVISSLPEERARTLFNNLGLGDLGAQLFCFPEAEEAFPRADCWLKVAKSMNKNPLYCGVLAGSQTAAKSALSAGMPCVAVPDSFTAFQDFGGVNAVFENFSDASVDELLAVLCPHLPA